jgi:hypothetical protein
MTRIGCRCSIRRETTRRSRVHADSVVNAHRKLARKDTAGTGGYKFLLHLGSIAFSDPFKKFDTRLYPPYR